MSIISKLKTIIEGENLQFMYDSGGNLEHLLDLADWENGKCVVFAFLLSESQLIEGKETANVGLFFSKLSDLDADSFTNDKLQDECKAVAWNFLQAVNSGNVLSYNTVSLRRFIDDFQISIAGVAVNADFTEMSGLTVCL